MLKGPCKNCPERHLGCHSTCEIYRTFVKENDRFREAMREKKAEDKFFLRTMNKRKD